MTDGGDQRADDFRPIVAADRISNAGLWIFVAVLAIGAIALFSALNARRAELNAPQTIAPASGTASRIAAPPALAVPRSFREETLAPRPAIRPVRAAPVALQRTAPIVPQPVRQIPPQPVPPPTVPIRQEPAAPAIVFDANRSSAGLPAQATEGQGEERVQAGRFLNPSLTVPQGTVIPAVLETALDSTRPGGVRALVQLDVRGFDGTRILIDRGSRLYGEYEAGLQPGQKRALIRWTRLIRPDGVTIALDSPASDPLGRAGVKGKVDSKFFQRFGSAILQSVLDIGVGIATQEATDGVFVALPGSTQNVTGTQTQQVVPTLKVKHGTSVSVFVARDLDFSSVSS